MIRFLLWLNIGLAIWLGFSLFGLPWNDPPIHADQITLISEAEPEASQIPDRDLTQTQISEPVAKETIATEDQTSPPIQEKAPIIEKEPELYCGRIGPFKRKRMVQQWSEQHLPEAEIILADAPIIKGYWVLLSNPDREQAQIMQQRLQQAGIKDIWLIRKGDKKNAISLGFFRQLRLADKQRNWIEQKGFFPQIVPEHKMVKRYWIQFDQLDLDAVENLAAQLKGSLEMQKKLCSGSSVSAQ